MLKQSLLAIAVIALQLDSALADPHHRGHDRHGYHRNWDRHHHEGHRPRTVVSFNFGSSPSYTHRRYYAPPVSAPQVIYINNDNGRLISNDGDRYCREYYTRATIGGAYQQTYGRACMQPDGSWEIIS